jgi:hypothetical protein
LTAVWTVKEATMKALGLGMHLRPDEIIVTAMEPMSHGFSARTVLQGRAQEQFETLDGVKLLVDVFIEGKRARAIARLETKQVTQSLMTNTPSALDPHRERASLELAAAVAALLKHKNMLPGTPVSGPAKGDA